MAQQIDVDAGALAGDKVEDGTHAVTSDLTYLRLAIVNVAYFGAPGRNVEWVLVDAGIAGTAGKIAKAASERFGDGSRPAAIVLTHGHFDHVGALEELLNEWDVPVYAHTEEFPFLDCRSSYPPPDPSVGGGMMARLSRFYPRGPIDVSRWLRRLPADGFIPHMPEWRWLHTPGHTPGHVSLWRQTDGTLITGDAFITAAQESAYAVLTQRPELHGPPMYYTPDWNAAAPRPKNWLCSSQSLC